MITVHHEIKQEDGLYIVYLHFVQDGKTFAVMYPRLWRDGSFTMSSHKTAKLKVSKERAFELLEKQLNYFESLSKPKQDGPIKRTRESETIRA